MRFRSNDKAATLPKKSIALLLVVCLKPLLGKRLEDNHCQLDAFSAIIQALTSELANLLSSKARLPRSLGCWG
jgi:hypothetical protein